MSIYDKRVDQISADDIQELLTSGAVENVRLEFKRQDPNRDEWLKKLTSFGNTYGGYLVLGADADSATGALVAISGVDPVAGLNQRLVQWATSWVTPPLRLHVSAAIPVTPTGDRVAYVVFVPESLETPHFINSRRGAYVRTDELSDRFEPRLATYEEIQHLSERRALARARRKALLGRAEQRFETFIANEYAGLAYTTGPIGATLKLSLCPTLPVAELWTPSALVELIEVVRLPWRQVGFPGGSSVTQHESALVLEPGGGFSLLEVATWGQAFYALELERVVEDRNAIHLHSAAGHVLIFLEHASQCYERGGFNGVLSIIVKLERIRGIPFVEYPGNRAHFGPTSRFDNDVTFELSVPVQDLYGNRDQIARSILERIFFATNWAALAADGAALDRVVRSGHEYNGFGR